MKANKTVLLFSFIALCGLCNASTLKDAQSAHSGQNPAYNPEYTPAYNPE